MHQAKDSFGTNTWADNGRDPDTAPESQEAASEGDSLAVQSSPAVQGDNSPGQDRASDLMGGTPGETPLLSAHHTYALLIKANCKYPCSMHKKLCNRSGLIYSQGFFVLWLIK